MGDLGRFSNIDSEKEATYLFYTTLTWNHRFTKKGLCILRNQSTFFPAEYEFEIKIRSNGKFIKK